MRRTLVSKETWAIPSRLFEKVMTVSQIVIEFFRQNRIKSFGEMKIEIKASFPQLAGVCTEQNTGRSAETIDHIRTTHTMSKNQTRAGHDPMLFRPVRLTLESEIMGPSSFVVNLRVQGFGLDDNELTICIKSNG